MSQVTGKVKWIDHNKNYGFIDHNGKDIFFYRNAIQGDAKSLNVGDNVGFEIADMKFPQAKNVTKL